MMFSCPQCKEENPRKFRHCGYCGSPLHPEAAPPAPLPPREVRRTVSIVFCDLKDSTALGERLDPEALHEVKDRYFAAMAAQITRHGGKIEKYIGDAIMAVFGLPVLHEDDALRAVRAAAGMQAALHTVNEELLAHYGVELAMRTGVNTGEIVANDDPTADQKLATGDAVNVVARLEQAAPANEIYLGATTYRLVRDAVHVETVEPLVLKGKQERVPAYRLVSMSGVGNVRRLDAPIVGREEELTAIDRALHEVSETGSARLITLIGDAGIGKSRLAREVIARTAASTRVVRGRCLAYGDGITFWPLREMVSEAAGIHFEDAPSDARAKLAALLPDADVAARIAAAIGLSGAAFPMHEISWAARKFFESLAAAGLAVALIDDIHWAEQAFLDLIEHVQTSADKAPILLLCTARHDLLDKRPQWGEGDASLQLVLRPLSDAAAADVAANLLGSTGLAPDVVARIVTAAEGNPLYVEQILSMLVESKALELRDGRWGRADDQRELGIPPTIKALLEARLGQLGVEERTAIEPASVIGLQFPSLAVASMAPERFKARIDNHLQALTKKHFVHAVPMPDEDPNYRFNHHLIRDTVYHGLLKRRRATLHVDFVRWADKINAERGRGLEFDEILGYHLEQAQRCLGELGPLAEKAREIGRDGARRLSSAGRRAFARGDMHAAANLLRRAVALLAESDPLRLPLLPELGEVLLEVGQFDDARSAVDETLAKVDPQRDRRIKVSAEIVRLLLRLHSGEPGKWGEAVLALTDETIPALEREQAHAELAKVWRLVALVQQNSGRLGEAAASIEKVVANARLAGDQRLVSRSALGLALGALYGPTPVAEAIVRCETLVADGLADRQVQNLIVCKVAHLHAMNSDFAKAREMCVRARAVLRDLGRGVRSASASLDLAAVELLAGDPAAAERELRPDCEMLEKMGETYFLSSMAAMLARAVREQGRDAEALELTRLAEKSGATDDIDAQVLWRSVRAPILARCGAIEDAVAMARVALDMARQFEEAPGLRAAALSELGAVLALAARHDEAKLVIDEAVQLYTAKGDAISARRARSVLDEGLKEGPLAPI
jgi:class 3 adenylate cyclase/tetratricopeptide (TPR) repeat protein